MPPKTETEIIQLAYEASVSQVYAIFFESMSSTQSGETQRQAEESFARGMKLARRVRDRALQLLA